MRIRVVHGDRVHLTAAPSRSRTAPCAAAARPRRAA